MRPSNRAVVPLILADGQDEPTRKIGLGRRQLDRRPSMRHVHNQAVHPSAANNDFRCFQGGETAVPATLTSPVPLLPGVGLFCFTSPCFTTRTGQLGADLTHLPSLQDKTIQPRSKAGLFSRRHEPFA